jgi:uncharacterized SAM-binding protein YcdF (DUF218 family)
MFFKKIEKVFLKKDDPLPKKADVIIGLGFGLSVDGEKCSPQLKKTVEKCLDLLKEGKAENLIFTGGFRVGNGPTEAEAMKEYLFSLPEGDKYDPVLEKESWRTYGNANNCLLIMQINHWRTAIIVTQQWHFRRARATFVRNWHGKGLEFYFVKSFSDYGGNYQTRLNSWPQFALFDLLAWVNTKVRGLC